MIRLAGQHCCLLDPDGLFLVDSGDEEELGEPADAASHHFHDLRRLFAGKRETHVCQKIWFSQQTDGQSMVMGVQGLLGTLYIGNKTFCNT